MTGNDRAVRLGEVGSSCRASGLLEKPKKDLSSTKEGFEFAQPNLKSWVQEARSRSRALVLG
jgi:hypothetical protein